MSYEESADELLRIDERCDAFESAWRRGERPRIGDFIGPADEPYRNRLFCELLLVEQECRRRLSKQSAGEDTQESSREFATTSLRHGASALFVPPANGDDGMAGSRIEAEGENVDLQQVGAPLQGAPVATDRRCDSIRARSSRRTGRWPVIAISLALALVAIALSIAATIWNSRS